MKAFTITHGSHNTNEEKNSLIIADSFEKALAMFRDRFPSHEIADTQSWSHIDFIITK